MPVDFYPRSEGDRLTFLAAFLTAFGDQSTALGFVAADVTEITSRQL